MSRPIKALLVILAVVVGFAVVALVSVYLFFDPNDFKDKISAGVKAETGRDLVIDGDMSLTLFPWVAIQVGHTELGNADGFTDELFMSFDQANLSVRVMPLILQRRVEVGTATLEGLNVNLEIASDGGTNWDDLTSADTEPTPDDDTAAAAPIIDVSNIAVTDANVSYADRQAGSTYSISGLTLETGRIAADTAIPMSAEFDFEAAPGELGGHVAMRGTAAMTEGAAQLTVSGLNVAGSLRGIAAEPTDVNFDAREINVDTVAQNIDAGEMDLTVLGLSMAADVEPFSYAGTPEPRASLRVQEFSLKELMQVLDIEPPITADPNAMQRVSFSANAAVGSTAIALSSLTLDLDDSKMTGSLSVPTTETGALQFELNVDTIAMDRYMAPADDSVTADENAADADIEIPVDLIRTLNAQGSFKIDQATLSGMEFEDLELGVNASDGKLRLHPLAANFYDGSYSGDVGIDATGDVPSVSANENIKGVNLASMAKAMFDQDQVSGMINGSFVLGGSGKSLAAIRQDLDGNMSMELLDGAWEGTDVWHQIRKARALYRQETPPEPTLPARTEFTSVTATGVVTKGIFQNDDFLAELPFLQLTGAGKVDLTSTEVDYGMQVRVLERPELAAGATEAELADLTETVIPLKITGLLSSPSIRPDIGGIFKARVDEAIEEKKEEIKEQLLDRILGGSDDPEGAADEETEEDPEEDLKKDLLKKIFQR